MAQNKVRRARLTTVDWELSGLGAQYDLAMSAFKFDEARELQERIDVLEQERAELAAALPTPAPPPLAAPVPIVVASRRGRRPLRRYPNQRQS
jgi:hypothetical protein